MQNEKSQIQNRAAAMRVLQTRLLLLQKEEEAAKKKELAGGNITASWGRPDALLLPVRPAARQGPAHRLRVRQPVDRLRRDLDGFISAGIRWRKRKDDDD